MSNFIVDKRIRQVGNNTELDCAIVLCFFTRTELWIWYKIRFTNACGFQSFVNYIRLCDPVGRAGHWSTTHKQVTKSGAYISTTHFSPASLRRPSKLLHSQRNVYLLQ